MWCSGPGARMNFMAVVSNCIHELSPKSHVVFNGLMRESLGIFPAKTSRTFLHAGQRKGSFSERSPGQVLFSEESDVVLSSPASSALGLRSCLAVSREV
jgi:hypothetical protein